MSSLVRNGGCFSHTYCEVCYYFSSENDDLRLSHWVCFRSDRLVQIICTVLQALLSLRLFFRRFWFIGRCDNFGDSITSSGNSIDNFRSSSGCVDALDFCQDLVWLFWYIINGVTSIVWRIVVSGRIFWNCGIVFWFSIIISIISWNWRFWSIVSSGRICWLLIWNWDFFWLISWRNWRVVVNRFSNLGWGIYWLLRWSWFIIFWSWRIVVIFLPRFSRPATTWFRPLSPDTRRWSIWPNRLAKRTMHAI